MGMHVTMDMQVGFIFKSYFAVVYRTYFIGGIQCKIDIVGDDYTRLIELGDDLRNF